MATKATTQPVPTPATTTTEGPLLVIRHKADGKAPSRLTEKAKKATAKALASARVRRPGLEALLESGAFHRLPMIQQAVIDNPQRLWDEHDDETTYLVIPTDSFGRAPKTGERDWDSTAQSILLWVKKYYCETEAPAFRASEVSITVVRFED